MSIRTFPGYIKGVMYVVEFQAIKYRSENCFKVNLFYVQKQTRLLD